MAADERHTTHEAEDTTPEQTGAGDPVSPQPESASVPTVAEPEAIAPTEIEPADESTEHRAAEQSEKPSTEETESQDAKEDPSFSTPSDPLALVFRAPDLAALPTVPVRRSTEDQTDEDQGEDQEKDDDSQQRSERSDDVDSGENRDQQGGSRNRGRKRRRNRGRSGGQNQGQQGQGGPGGGSKDSSASDQDTAETADTAGTSGRRSAGSTDGRTGKDDGGQPDSDSTGRQGSQGEQDEQDEQDEQSNGGQNGGGQEGQESSVSRRRRRRRRGNADLELEGGSEGDPENTVTRVRAPRQGGSTGPEAVTGVKGSTRLEAKKQRRRDSRQGGKRRHAITEAEFLARRESVARTMVVRQREHRIQIGVLEDGVLAEHFVSNTTQDSLIGNVYLGKVQNVLPSMEAAFVDIGRGRNAVLYAGEVDWDAAKLEGKPRKIENALKSGDSVLVQVTKDPVGHKGARLTSQISLPGRYLVYVPGGSMTGISRKLPDVERSRLKKILKDHLPENAGVIVRTAAEGTSEQELMNDINRLRAQWQGIEGSSRSTKVLAPELLYAEPDLTIKVVRDVFNEDFSAMVVQGDEVWDNIEAYITYVAPHLLERASKWDPAEHDGEDLFAHHRIDEQLHKALERKVFLPSGGSLVLDRTEAMTVVDVNTGKFTGSGGNLEETVTKNNLEAAEEIVRQLRLRDIGGIIVIDFIDMVLESNRDLVLRRLLECLGRDRTKHQVAEVTSLGLVQMTRKRMGTGLVEVFSETCEACNGRGILIHDVPVEHRKSTSHSTSHQDSRHSGNAAEGSNGGGGNGSRKSSRSERRRRSRERQSEREQQDSQTSTEPELTAEEEAARKAKAEATRAALATIAAASQSTGKSGTKPDVTPDKDEQAERAADDLAQRHAGRGSDTQTAPIEDALEASGRATDDDAHGTEGLDEQGTEAATEQPPTTLTIGGEQVQVPRPTRPRSRRAGAAQGAPGASAPESVPEPAAEAEPGSGRQHRSQAGPAMPQDSSEGQGGANADLAALEHALDEVQQQKDSADVGAQTTAQGTTQDTAQGTTPATTLPTAAPTRRRGRRAASSDGTSGQIHAVELSADSSAGAIFQAGATTGATSVSGPQTADTDTETETAAPAILGVGVKAEEIIRAE